MKSCFDAWKIFAIIILFIVFLINPANSQTADEWLYRGNSLYASGEYEKAIEAYDRAIAINPNLKDAWLNKGAILAELGKYDKAIEAFNKATTIDPNYKEAWLGKGIVLNGLGRHGEAVESFDKSIAIDPNFGEALVFKGLAFYRLGEYDKAIESFERAMAIDQNFKEVFGPVYEKAKENRQLAIDQMAETALPMEQEKYWLIIGGIVIFIFIESGKRGREYPGLQAGDESYPLG